MTINKNSDLNCFGSLFILSLIPNGMWKHLEKQLILRHNIDFAFLFFIDIAQKLFYLLGICMEKNVSERIICLLG